MSFWIGFVIGAVLVLLLSWRPTKRAPAVDYWSQRTPIRPPPPAREPPRSRERTG